MVEDVDGIDRKIEPTPMTDPVGASGVADHSLHPGTQGFWEDVSGDPGEGVRGYAGGRGRDRCVPMIRLKDCHSCPWLSPRCE